MTQIGILESEFPWGLLVISDAQSDLQVPDFASREVPTSASRDAAVLRVMHAFEGEVLVRIWDDANDLNSLGTHCLNTSLTLAVPSGTLVVGDVERNTVVTASVQPGHYDIHIFADAPEQPEIVDLVLVPAGDEFVKQAGRTVERMSLPLMRDPRQRDPRLQLIIKIVVFAGMGIGGLLIAIVALSKLMS